MRQINNVIIHVYIGDMVSHAARDMVCSALEVRSVRCPCTKVMVIYCPLTGKLYRIQGTRALMCILLLHSTYLRLMTTWLLKQIQLHQEEEEDLHLEPANKTVQTCQGCSYPGQD